jgi:hypothetical protein
MIWAQVERMLKIGRGSGMVLDIVIEIAPASSDRVGLYG